MLHAVAQLAEDVVGHVVRELRAEVHAHALGADQLHHLFHPLAQRVRRVVEQQVRLVEHEHQLGLVQVAHFRQLLEQLRQQPQQEARIRSEEHTSELQSLMRTSYAVFCLKKKTTQIETTNIRKRRT